ncbi:MAG: EamA family transporter [Rhizobiales bacterium PAR1]|nr:MAG: EamA family transporter [Rhizobiales bacterium PAR1]
MTAPTSAPPGATRRQRLVAIALMCCAFACFSALDATAKWLTPRIGVIETSWVRFTSAFLLAALVLRPWSHREILRSVRPKVQIIRALLLLASTILNFLALQYLQLTETMTIMFTQPLVVALISGPLLGEWIGPRRLAAIGVGFLGVLLITRPGAGGIHWAAVYSFIGVGCYAGYSMLTRYLAGHDSSATTLFYSSAAGVLLLSPVMLFIWHAKPDGWTLLMMAATGFWASLGHWLLILAHRHVSAAVLSPFLYTQIIWMLALGYFIFGDLPDRWTLAGASIVICAGIYLLHRERVRKSVDYA